MYKYATTRFVLFFLKMQLFIASSQQLSISENEWAKNTTSATRTVKQTQNLIDPLPFFPLSDIRKIVFFFNKTLLIYLQAIAW